MASATPNNFKLLLPSRSLRALGASASLPVLSHSPMPRLYKALARPLQDSARPRDFLYGEGLGFPATQQVGPWLWRVDLPFAVQLDDGATHYEILVPPGWETDYGSVPRIFWNIVPPLGRYSAAYVLHDYLYESEAFDRDVCDWLLLLALQDLGASWLERNTIYSAVREFGWIVWAGHDPAHVRSAKQLARVAQLKIMSKNNPYDLEFNYETRRYELKGAANVPLV